MPMGLCNSGLSPGVIKTPSENSTSYAPVPAEPRVAAGTPQDRGEGGGGGGSSQRYRNTHVQQSEFSVSKNPSQPRGRLLDHSPECLLSPWMAEKRRREAWLGQSQDKGDMAFQRWSVSERGCGLGRGGFL